MELKNNTLLVASTLRIPKEKRDEDIFYYDIRHSDFDSGEPATLEKRVIVNHFATIGVKKPINLGEEGFIELDEQEKEFILSSM